MSWITHHGRVIPSGTPTVVWDLDSTLRSTVHRRYLIPKIMAGEATWDDYSALCPEDTPIAGTCALLELFGASHFNIAVSGAADSALPQTKAWCEEYQVRLDDFLLRPAGDETENGEWKVLCINRLEAAGLDVQLAVEDWEAAALRIARETDVPVLGINPFDADAVTITEFDVTEAMEKVFAEVPWRLDEQLPASVPLALGRDVFADLKRRRKPVPADADPAQVQTGRSL